MQSIIEKELFHRKAIVVIGARQVGKSRTKLPKAFLETYDVEKTAVITPDNWTGWLL